MSAFLGPIHFWLYNKIRIQEQLTDSLADRAIQEGWGTEDTYGVYRSGECRPLEELIDTMNIHGWLQERIHDAETRFAGLTEVILKDIPERMDTLREAARAFGKQLPAEQESDAAALYRIFEDRLLNGMPCDHINQLLVQEEDRVIWEQSRDLHGEHWTALGMDPSVYYELRRAMMEGMLEGTDYVLTGDDRCYEISRKVG